MRLTEDEIVILKLKDYTRTSNKEYDMTCGVGSSAVSLKRNSTTDGMTNDCNNMLYNTLTKETLHPDQLFNGPETKVMLGCWHHILERRFSLLPRFSQVQNKWIWMRYFYEFKDIEYGSGLHSSWYWYRVVLADDLELTFTHIKKHLNIDRLGVSYIR